MRSARKLLALATVLSLLAPPARAQDVDTEEELQRPQEAAEEQQESVEAAEEAEERRATEAAPEIGYDDILKDPDNIELNYKYAQSLIQKGELRGAAATLERILMVDPALPRVRLLYGVVLYRLDSLREAQRELETLSALEMPDSLREELDEYLARIKRRLRKLNISSRFGLGFQYDSNRNAAPNAGRRLFGGVPVVLTTGRKEDDQSLIALANIAMTYDPGSQAGHTLDLDYTFYRAEQTEIDLLDFEAHTWKAGATLKSAYGDISPAAVLGYIELDNIQYLRTRGAQLGWERAINPKLSLHAALRSEFQEFVNTTSVPVADERTGQETSAALGGHYVVAPTQRLGFRFLFGDKDARRRYNAYRRKSMSGSHQWLLGKGRFLLTSLTVSVDDYDDADVAISRLVRTDTSTRLGSTFGMPLGMLARPLKDLIWTLTYEYFNSSSNIINYDYDNHRANMMFTYKFDL